MRESYRFVVGGRVQGVGFRAATLRRARALDLSGWVRNRESGDVEGVAAGTAEALAAFRAWLGRGPPGSRVERVQWLADDDVSGAFEVRR